MIILSLFKVNNLVRIFISVSCCPNALEFPNYLWNVKSSGFSLLRICKFLSVDCCQHIVDNFAVLEPIHVFCKARHEELKLFNGQLIITICIKLLESFCQSRSIRALFNIIVQIRCKFIDFDDLLASWLQSFKSCAYLVYLVVHHN